MASVLCRTEPTFVHVNNLFMRYLLYKRHQKGTQERQNRGHGWTKDIQHILNYNYNTLTVLLNQLGNIFQYRSCPTGSELENILPVELGIYFQYTPSKAGSIRGLARYRVHTTATWDQFWNIIKRVRNHSDGVFLVSP